MSGVSGNAISFIAAFSGPQWGPAFSHLLPIPKSISVANPSIDILDLETSWPALTWQSLTLWLSLDTLSPFTSPHEILLGEILWLSLDLPY